MNVRKTFRKGLACVVASTCTVVGAEVPLGSVNFPGLGWTGAAVIVTANDRFNPMAQRLLAEGALRRMPISEHRVLYLVRPVSNPDLQQDQIRYLEYLLRTRAQELRTNEEESHTEEQELQVDAAHVDGPNDANGNSDPGQ